MITPRATAQRSAAPKCPPRQIKNGPGFCPLYQKRFQFDLAGVLLESVVTEVQNVRYSTCSYYVPWFQVLMVKGGASSSGEACSLLSERDKTGPVRASMSTDSEEAQAAGSRRIHMSR
jgi:hypothetical protein